MELSEALTQHLDWKVRLRAALASNKTVEVESASDHAACTLGKWIEGDARQRYGHLESYRECQARHVHFHRQAGRVVACIGEGKTAEARDMLGMAGAFSVASGELIEAIRRLGKDIG
ncbi:MAG: CZB domain-containing protein [Thiobacillus sp.]|nr:CZB domain-containing protein [Thiobacillus sp.]